MLEVWYKRNVISENWQKILYAHDTAFKNGHVHHRSLKIKRKPYLAVYTAQLDRRKACIDVSRALSRPVARGVCRGATHPLKSAKRSTFSHKMGKKWGICKRVKGGEVQKVNFLGPKGPHFGGSAPPKINPGYGPGPVRVQGNRKFFCQVLVDAQKNL